MTANSPKHPTAGCRHRAARPRAGLTLHAASAAFAALLALAGCASQDTTRSGLFEPYRTDLPQGNYLTQQMLEQVQPGMRKSEVERILGTPLLVDVFKPEQDNYVFSFKHANGRVDLRRVRIRYDAQERVAAIQADELPEIESPSDPALPGFRPEAYGRTN